MSEPARTSEAPSRSADAACMTLLDLVAAVAEEAESDEEILLVVSDLIRSGNVDEARQLLTRPYRIRGMVTHGAARGAKIGFPTANLDAIDTLIPAIGVYAGRTYVDSRSHWSAIHIGPNPTFGEEHTKVESHLLDFEGSIYGEAIEVDFIGRLRDIRQFESAQQLTDQLKLDVDATRSLAREFAP